MDQTGYVIIAVIVMIALLVLLLLRNRKQHVSFGDTPVAPPAAPRQVSPPPVTTPTSAPAPAPVAVAEEEGHGVGSEISAAIEDVVDQFIGIDAHPSGQPAATGDALTTLKGLGPKAEARLHELGVTTFEQIATWEPNDVEAIDAQMGAFKGRIVRDRWVQQARLLAKGDTESFETEYGKLG